MNSARIKLSQAVRAQPITSGAVLGWLILAFVTLTIGTSALPHAGRLYDFRAFYGSGWLLLHHPTQLFDLSVQTAVQNAVVCPMWRGVPFYHPAYEAILYAPLALLSYRSAYLVFGLFNLLLLALCYLLAPSAADPRIAKVRALLFFAGFPAFMGIAEGQDSIVFLFLICLLWRALHSGRDRTAGILLALALFKLQIALALVFFLALYLPSPRRARLILSFIPSAAAVAFTCLLITGPRGIAEWLRLIASSSIASHQSHHAQAVIAVYPKAMPTLNGLLYVCGARFLPSRVSLALDALLCVIVFAAAVYLMRTLARKPGSNSSSLPAAFSAALAAAILLAPHLYLYDYVLLILPILLLRQPLHFLFTALYYVLTYILFAFGGLDWFAFLAIFPAILLVFLVNAERSEVRLPQTLTETVTSTS